MDNIFKNTHQFKKPISLYDDESSDDEENDVVFVPQQSNKRKSLPQMNSISKAKGYSGVPSFKTKMKPMPSLITAGRVNNNPNNYSRGDLMMSQVPGLTPIDRSKFFNFDTFRKKREAFNGTGHRVGTAGSSFGSRVSGFNFFFIYFKIHF